MSQPIVLTFTPSASSVFSRLDYDVTHGALEVTWRLTEQTYRYRISYETFVGLIGGALPASAMSDIAKAREPGEVAADQRLSSCHPDALAVDRDTIPATQQDAKDRFYAHAFQKNNSLTAWSSGALFG